MLGDGESAEGSVWEAAGTVSVACGLIALFFAAFAGIYKLDNLVAIIDVNRLGQSQATSLGHDVNTYAKRMEAFGFHSIIIDGHDIEAVLKAFHYAKTVKEQPIAIIAKTLKGAANNFLSKYSRLLLGKGIVNIEDKDGWHGKPVSADTIAPIASLIHNKGVTKLKPNAPIADAPIVDLNLGHIKLSSPPSYKLGEKVATRAAYGTALVKIGEGSDRIIALDGDTKNSTFSEKFLKRFPDRFIECFIAEQNMVGVAIGASTRNRTIPFCRFLFKMCISNLFI
jgi:transketolase